MTRQEIEDRLKRAVATKKGLVQSSEPRRELSVPSLIGYCDETISMCRAFLKLKERAFKSLSWMTKDMKWRFNETKGNLDNGSRGGYSKELQEAIETLKDLEK